MSEITVTTDEIEENYIYGRYDGNQMTLNAEEAGAEFDRWLAEHDAKVRAETLREFARSIPGDVHDPRHVADLARGVADHIEREAGLK